MVITARDVGVLTTLVGSLQQMELLTAAEALSLLASAAELPAHVLPREAIVSLCGYLPLAVAMCGSLVRRGKNWETILGAASGPARDLSLRRWNGAVSTPGSRGEAWTRRAVADWSLR